MTIIATEVFCGPNVHAQVALVRLNLDLGTLVRRAGQCGGEGFRRAALALAPGLEPAELAAPGADRKTCGAGLALLVAEIALELQRSLGAAVRYRQVEPADTADHYWASYELWDEAVAVAAAPLAIDALAQLVAGSDSAAEPFNAEEVRERMLKALRPASLDLITMAMVRAAVARGIPWYRLVARKPFVQLGQGAKHKHMRESASSHTTSTGRYLSKDKNATSLLLGRIGLPVPPQRLVKTVEEAVSAAAALGYPVVTKPLDRGNGKGVSVGLEQADQVRWGYGEARRYGEDVIVERFVAGEDHRILIVDGAMVAAAKRIPGHVVGDGTSTVAALVAAANEDPRRGREYDKLMVRLELDAQAEQVLSHAGLSRDSVPQAGEIVPLRRTANVSTGGTCIDVTDIVHPENREAAIRASRVLGLDVAGVDFLTTDITRSYRDVGGGICEVNFSPGLRPHWNSNPDRDVVGPIVATLFPAGAPSRIPVAAVLAERAGPQLCRLLARLLGAGARVAGAATSEGVEIAASWAARGDYANEAGVRTLIFDPIVEAAVVQCDPRQILARGLALQRCDAAVVLGLGASAERSAHDDDKLRAARVLIAAAEHAVVLDGEDPRSAALAEGTRAPRVGLVGRDIDGAALSRHAQAGGVVCGRSAAGAGERWVLMHGRNVVLEAPGAGVLGQSYEDFAPTLAAAAAAYCLGTPAQAIGAMLAGSMR